MPSLLLLLLVLACSTWRSGAPTDVGAPRAFDAGARQYRGEACFQKQTAHHTRGSCSARAVVACSSSFLCSFIRTDADTRRCRTSRGIDSYRPRAPRAQKQYSRSATRCRYWTGPDWHASQTSTGHRHHVRRVLGQPRTDEQQHRLLLDPELLHHLFQGGDLDLSHRRT